jgi:uncharacterized membrane protein
MNPNPTPSIGFYSFHIGLNIIGALLLLAGTMIAIFRNQIGSSWYNYHRGFQLSAITLIAISVILAIWLRSYFPRPDAKDQWWHGTIGIVLFILLLVQGWWAIIMKPQVEGSTFLWIHRVLAILIWVLLVYQIYLGWNIVSSTK